MKGLENEVKIIAGIAKGMPLRSPPQTTRPTSAKVREAVMSSLAPRMLDATIIDFFAGSGAMGCESLSRGAAVVHFLESNPNALRCLNQNLTSLKSRYESQNLPFAQAVVHSGDGFSQSVWRNLPSCCDILWADPPYDALLDWLSKITLTKLHEHLSPQGLLVIETKASHTEALLTCCAPLFSNHYKKQYGQTAVLSFSPR